MARIRSVKPSLRTSRVVVQWPMEVRYFWVLLWGYLDDEGRGLDSPKAIAGDCFPLDDAITSIKVDRWLSLIAASKTADKEPPICRYEVAGARYIHAVNWHEHQRPNRPKPSLHPPCPVHAQRMEGFSESDTEAPRAGGGEVGGGELEGGGGVTASLTAAVGSAPPSPFCRKHPDGTDDPCGACGRARKARQAWDDAQAERDTRAKAARQAELDAAPKCRDCGRSTASAYHRNSCGNAEDRAVAEHEATTARGVAAARAALREPRRRTA